MSEEKRKNDERENNVPEAIVPAFVLIGIGLIFWLGLGFWPWILAVAGAASLAGAMVRGDLTWWHLDGILWTFGIMFLALTGFWWPGILILIGLSMLLKAMIGTKVVSDYADRKLKRKRGFVPPIDDDRFV
ncbi:MAG TPA: hypothetical protein PKD09_18380 [Aggregatilinea sp.]|jgi:hypothetical protein|uniref:hypothetical protein n=1 Tax=Aggregatilinea sp. TaxID=2806333 RepID=UPI002BC69375|nr:hypothetical protein [Aggregatilinea sp.]HML23629.1 hypothetical protein [Aggregatilinea sp.]